MAKKSARKGSGVGGGKRKGATGSRKVGASGLAAKRFGGKGDFGTPAAKAHPAGRRVKTRVGRPGGRAGADEGQRVVGAGAYGTNPGKSGGAADTDIIGIGTEGGSSVSTEGTLGKRRGKDVVRKGGSAAFASGGPAEGKNQAKFVGKVGGDKRVKGTTHNASDENASGVGDLVDLANREPETFDPMREGMGR